MKILSKHKDTFHGYIGKYGIDDKIVLDLIHNVPNFDAFLSQVIPNIANTSSGITQCTLLFLNNKIIALKRNTKKVIGEYAEVIERTLTSYTIHHTSDGKKIIFDAPEFIKQFAKDNNKPIFFFRFQSNSNHYYSVSNPDDQHKSRYEGIDFIPLMKIPELYERINPEKIYRDAYNLLIEYSQSKEAPVKVENDIKIQQYGFDLKTSFRRRKSKLGGKCSEN